MACLVSPSFAYRPEIAPLSTRCTTRNGRFVLGIDCIAVIPTIQAVRLWAMRHVQVLDLGRSVRALFAPLFRYLTFFFRARFSFARSHTCTGRLTCRIGRKEDSSLTTLSKACSKKWPSDPSRIISTDVPANTVRLPLSVQRTRACV